MKPFIKDFILMMADNSLILGQRLGEWCGHGPVLEQDIAITNIALDLIGEARSYYHYLAEQEGKQEDDYPMFRSERQFKNVLLVEQPNGHYGTTIMRQFMYDCYHYHLLQQLISFKDKQVAAIAQKTIKEARYHLSFSGEWVVRLGDGTEESHEKMQQTLHVLLPFRDEMYLPSSYEKACEDNNYGLDLKICKEASDAHFYNILERATLSIPENIFAKKGGKDGLHSEHLGFILTELQYMQRSYPGLEW